MAIEGGEEQIWILNKRKQKEAGKEGERGGAGGEAEEEEPSSSCLELSL